MKLIKDNLIKIIILVSMIVLTLIALIPINENYKPVTWMQSLSNETLINEMAIPGTHDSGATHSLFDVSGKCQDLDILNQLNIGVRFLDIRLKLVNNELNIVHSYVDQDLKFIKVLEIVNEFIDSNKSEFLIISIKEDDSSKNSTISFSDKVYKEISKYENIVLDNKLPKTLGEARGKIYILNRYTNEDIGINAYNNWKDSTTFDLNNMHIQDNYCVDSVEEKKLDIINAFDFANKNKEYLTLNYISCYIDGGFPPTYANTPCNYLNKWLPEYIENNEINGIVLIDFATESLVNKIYMENNYE